MPGPASVDLPVKLGVAGGALALVAALVALRFCGVPPLPPKPPRPAAVNNPQAVAKRINAKTEAYMQGVERDALRAGVATPTLADMGRPITYERSVERRVIVPGKPAIEVAGLRISAATQRVDGELLLVLVIDNPGPAPRAYLIATEVGGGTSACAGRRQPPYNGMVVAAQGREIRSECAYHSGSELYVSRVESAVLTPLQAFYVSRVGPGAVGVDERVTRGHKPSLPSGIDICNLVMSQSVRSSLEDGSMGWRDLVDFYARHNCDSYQYIQGYQAFEAQDEYALPVVGR